MKYKNVSDLFITKRGKKLITRVEFITPYGKEVESDVVDKVWLENTKISWSEIDSGTVWIQWTETLDKPTCYVEDETIVEGKKLKVLKCK